MCHFAVADLNMNWIGNQSKLISPQIKLVYAIGLTLLSFAPVQAAPDRFLTSVQSNNPSSDRSHKVNKSLIFNTPPPPKDIGAPSDRASGGTRGCGNISQQPTRTGSERLTALAPEYKSQDSELVWGSTTDSRPTFWFYIPDGQKVEAEFVLQDPKKQSHYASPISLSGTPGVINFPLPSTIPSLEIGNQYRWYLSIKCQPEQTPIFVAGEITRVSLSPQLKSQLEKASPERRIQLLGSHGIWYDALTTAATLRRADQKSNDWSTLLQEVDLANIARKPLVSCCQPEIENQAERSR